MMATWRQADRPNSHWDGSFVDKMTRNAGAALGTTFNPADYRTENAFATTDFTAELPPVPYPFDVDMTKANRGEVLFHSYCASCHGPGSTTILKPAVTGTDPNRAESLRSYGRAKLIKAARDGLCRVPTACKNPDGTELTDDQIISLTGGYVALPLAGVWATAPYLHNGSVPTLRALLTGDRPAKFYRGNIAYDQKNVGFKYDVQTANTTEYDTSLSGFSNAGHTGTAFLGDVDWKTETGKLDDLLEYMKTL
jgi:mono/diheme cytochrome c family protein